jgi:hypothetical protein
MAVNVPDFDYGTYEENQRRFPQEELNKYAGQYVAFSLDGARILASGASGPKWRRNWSRRASTPRVLFMVTSIPRMRCIFNDFALSL